MATVDFISYRFVDNDGNSGTSQIFLPSGATVSELQTFSNSLAPLIDDVTAAVIDSATLTLALTLPGTLKANPIAGMYIAHGANFGFDAADTVYKHTIRIPAILETLLAGESVDTGDADVQAFVAGIVSGFGADQASDRYANDLTALISAERSFRKR